MTANEHVRDAERCAYAPCFSFRGARSLSGASCAAARSAAVQLPPGVAGCSRGSGEFAGEPDAERLAYEDEFGTGRELREKTDVALLEVARLETPEDR